MKIVPLSRTTDTKEIPKSITFSWDAASQKMTLKDPQESLIPLIMFNTITKAITTFEKKSGVKKDSCALLFFLTLLIVSIGYGGSYLLIISSEQKLGAIGLILTCLIVYFSLMFTLHYRGDQLQRIETFVNTKGEEFQKEILKEGYFVVFSFQKG